MNLFDDNVRVTARTRGATGELVVTRLNRDEFVQSTLTSLAQLEAFQSQRSQTTARLADSANCQLVEVKSTVLERGRTRGRDYQMESVEEFELQRQGDVWRARTAQTTQTR